MYTFSGLLRKNKEEKVRPREEGKFVVINISDVIYIFEQEKSQNVYRKSKLEGSGGAFILLRTQVTAYFIIDFFRTATQFVHPLLTIYSNDECEWISAPKAHFDPESVGSGE